MNGLELADIVGIIAFSLSGFLVATRDRLDLLGVFIASFLTALGGGILRDTIADRTPYTFSHLLPTLLVIGVIICSIILSLHKQDKIENKLYFIISDSIGLVSFSISGALIGLMAGLNIFGVIMLALTTAVGGGVMRDILLNKIPVFLVSELYGSVSIFVGVLVYCVDYYYHTDYVSLVIIFTIGLTFRLVAYYKKWSLPKLG